MILLDRKGFGLEVIVLDINIYDYFNFLDTLTFDVTKYLIAQSNRIARDQ